MSKLTEALGATGVYNEGRVVIAAPMTARARTAAQIALDDADAELESAGEGIDALRDGDMFDSAALRAASAAVRDARANVTLVLDGLRFP